jgi:hypothetical protein
MSPDFSAEPTVRAAIQLNEARVRSVSLKQKLMLYLPLPLDCYLLFQALSLAQEFDGAPETLFRFAVGLMRGFYAAGAFSCFFLSLRTYLEVKRSQR